MGAPSSATGFIFIGPPGSGKGTQADLLKATVTGQVCHLSTGDMLRAAIASGSELGQKVKPILSSGGLVSDDLMVPLVKEAILHPSCSDGFILDGFPRTLEQAQRLDKLLEDTKDKQIDHVFDFQIGDEAVLQRILGRLLHKPSGRTYHETFKPPKVPMTDDITGEPLIRRSDDNEDSLKQRLKGYHTWTVPVVAYYKAQSKLTSIDATAKPNDVFAQIKKAMNKE